MILVCLDGNEEAQEALAAAEALAGKEGLRPVVVRVWTDDGPKSRSRAGPTEWTLRAAAPVEPLLRFIRRNRIRHIVMGGRAWARWGRDLRAMSAPKPGLSRATPA